MTTQVRSAAKMVCGAYYSYSMGTQINRKLDSNADALSKIGGVECFRSKHFESSYKNLKKKQ